MLMSRRRRRTMPAAESLSAETRRTWRWAGAEFRVSNGGIHLFALRPGPLVAHRRDSPVRGRVAELGMAAHVFCRLLPLFPLGFAAIAV